MAGFELPGEYIYDGTVMCEASPPAILDRIKHLQLDDEDVIVATYPKSGTTWMQEILYLVHSNGDFERANKILLIDRVPFFELWIPDEFQTLDIILANDPPRLLKTHLSAKFFERTLANRKTKFIVVLRNPKDTLVSYYHFYMKNVAAGPFEGSWNEFFTLFKSKRLLFGDIFELTLSWWKLRDDPRLLVVKYEDMIRDPKLAIRQVASHLGRTISPHLVDRIAERTSFQTMKNNPALNYSKISFANDDISPLMRKGTIGDWVNYFSQDQSDYIDSLCEKYYKPERLFFEYGA